MESRMSRMWLRILTALALVSFAAIGVAAQDDPDPNSPTPVLMTVAGSARAMVQSPGKINVNAVQSRVFPMNAKVVFFVSNVTLAEGEGLGAFRLYGVDRNNHEFRFPVLSIERTPSSQEMYAVTVLLTDEIGYWEAPARSTELSLFLTWRGLASNSVSMGPIAPVSDLIDPVAPKATGKKTGREVPAGTESPSYVGYRWSGDRTRFLEQATFGPTPATDQRVRRIGIRSWLAEQFAAQYPTTNAPYPSQPLKPTNAPPDCDNNPTVPDVPVTCFRDTYSMYPVQQWFMQEALYSDSQLRHRVAFALSQIFVTSGVDIQQSRHIVEYHKILSANAFGNFRTLMKQMTLNPTMGDYLDMSRSTKTNPNENYAREIMQLFTVGLYMLNPNGTQACVEHTYPDPCRAGDTPIPTYDQTTVNNLTKVLTGWGFCNTAASCPNLAIGTVNFIDPMLLNSANHDLTAKSLLSNSTNPNIPVCPGVCTSVADRTAYANASLDQAMDNIFNHPNVGPFISKNLIRQMITSDPTPAYVGRVAAVFNNNGFGVRGDMQAVVRAILLDPEARGDKKTDPNYGKLREPVLFATNFLKAFNPRSADGSTQSDGWILGRPEFTGMGQLPFRSPTVFNYFPPDYIFSTPTGSIVGPEFALMTTGTAIQRQNFINRFVYTVQAVPVSTDAPNGTSLDFSDLQAIASSDTSSGPLLDELNRRMMHSTMSAAMRSNILTAVNAIPSTSQANFLLRAQQAVHLIATSSQYQVQR